MIGIFMVGQRANLFRKQVPLRDALRLGLGPRSRATTSRLNGVVVGNVLEVSLSGDPADRTVRVVYDVVRRWAPMLRKGTRASIKTRGLLGDKYIELEGGKADEPEVPDRRRDPGGARAPGIEKLLEGSGDLLTDLGGDRQVAQEHPRPHREGRGLPRRDHLQQRGERAARQQLQRRRCTRSTPSSRRSTAGKGLAGQAPHRREVRQARRATRSRARSGPSSRCSRRSTRACAPATGAIPALLSDPEGKKKIYALVDNLGLTAAGLVAGHREPREGQRRDPDPAARRAVRQGVHRRTCRASRSTSTRSARKLDDGQGTAGKLINDPSRLRRRQPPRRRRRRVGAAALADQGPAEGGHQEGVQRRGPTAQARRRATPTPRRSPAVKLLITGGAGFIGSHLADRRLARGRPGRRARRLQRLLRPGAQARATSPPHLGRPALPAGRGRHPRPRARRPPLRRGAVRRGHPPRGARGRAAVARRSRSSTRRSTASGRCTCSRRPSRTASPRFVFASSSSVYGINSKLPVLRGGPVDRPISPYATTKRAGELQSSTPTTSTACTAVCLRFFTVYGPRQRPEMAIARFIRCLEAGRADPVLRRRQLAARLHLHRRHRRRRRGGARAPRSASRSSTSAARTR